MSKRVCNKKGRQRVTPARSKAGKIGWRRAKAIDELQEFIQKHNEATAGDDVFDLVTRAKDKLKKLIPKPRIFRPQGR